MKLEGRIKMSKNKKPKHLYPFDHTTGDGQKRLMAFSMGKDPETYIAKPIVRIPGEDYGCDPLEDGMFKMIPSGDIVDYKEMKKRRNLK